MATEAAAFAVFKYKHGSRSRMSPARRKWLLGTLLLAALGSIVLFPGGLALFLAPLLVWLTVPRQLALGPRYLICGEVIVYYGNVDQVLLDRQAGKLTLVSAGDRRFSIERERFPTNARKSHKIAANKEAKFGKVAGKLIEKIRHASPAVEVSGA
ncbi:MAG: hypothetical protein HYU78_00650 [Rhodocyclales bacterium]|nr:hypothetical protein [Rhodocyclales bacterium]